MGSRRLIEVNREDRGKHGALCPILEFKRESSNLLSGMGLFLGLNTLPVIGGGRRIVIVSLLSKASARNGRSRTRFHDVTRSRAGAWPLYITPFVRRRRRREGAKTRGNALD